MTHILAVTISHPVFRRNSLMASAGRIARSAFTSFSFSVRKRGM
jgi:hypothetical protein